CPACVWSTRHVSKRGRQRFLCLSASVAELGYPDVALAAQQSSDAFAAGARSWAAPMIVIDAESRRLSCVINPADRASPALRDEHRVELSGRDAVCTPERHLTLVCPANLHPSFAHVADAIGVVPLVLRANPGLGSAIPALTALLKSLPAPDVELVGWLFGATYCANEHRLFVSTRKTPDSESRPAFCSTTGRPTSRRRRTRTL